MPNDSQSYNFYKVYKRQLSTTHPVPGDQQGTNSQVQGQLSFSLLYSKSI